MNRSVRAQNDHFSPVGVIRLPKGDKTFRSGDHFIHSEISYRGIILYAWPGTIVKNGNRTKERFYQVLVDNRDSEEIPMEHELLRISDEDREAVNFVS